MAARNHNRIAARRGLNAVDLKVLQAAANGMGRMQSAKALGISYMRVVKVRRRVKAQLGYPVNSQFAKAVEFAVNAGIVRRQVSTNR